MGLQAGLSGCGRFRPHRSSNLETSSPSRVSIPTELPRLPHKGFRRRQLRTDTTSDINFSSSLDSFVNFQTHGIILAHPSWVLLKCVLNITHAVIFVQIQYFINQNKEGLNTGVSRDSSVGTATHYGLDGPWIEPRWGEIFRIRPDRTSGPLTFLYNGYQVSFPGVKRPESGADHITPPF